LIATPRSPQKRKRDPKTWPCNITDHEKESREFVSSRAASQESLLVVSPARTQQLRQRYPNTIQWRSLFNRSHLVRVLQENLDRQFKHAYAARWKTSSLSTEENDGECELP